MKILFQVWMILLIVCLKFYDMRSYHEGWRIKDLNLDEVYVINLDSSTVRLARISGKLAKHGVKFKRLSAVYGLDLQMYDMRNRYTDVDIRNFDWSLSLNSNVQHLVYYPRIPEAAFIADSVSGRPESPVYGYFTPGELGCIYSHRAAWCDIVKNRHKVALILEDDAVLNRNFRDIIRDSIHEIPQDADLIWVDFWEYRAEGSPKPLPWLRRDFDILPLPGNKNVGVLKNPERYILGAYAYILTLKGAQKLLAISSRVKRCVDVIMTEGRLSGKLNVYFFKYKPVRGVVRDASVIDSLGRTKCHNSQFTAVS